MYKDVYVGETKCQRQDGIQEHMVDVKLRRRLPVGRHFSEKCHNMGIVARKPVFGVSDRASFKPVSSATETS